MLYPRKQLLSIDLSIYGKFFYKPNEKAGMVFDKKLLVIAKQKKKYYSIEDTAWKLL